MSWPQGTLFEEKFLFCLFKEPCVAHHYGESSKYLTLSLQGRVSLHRRVWAQQSAHSLTTARSCAQHVCSCQGAEQAKWPKPRAKSHQAGRFSSLSDMLFDLLLRLKSNRPTSCSLSFPFSSLFGAHYEFRNVRPLRWRQNREISPFSKTSLFSSHTTPTQGSPTKVWQDQSKLRVVGGVTYLGSKKWGYRNEKKGQVCRLGRAEARDRLLSLSPPPPYFAFLCLFCGKKGSES